MLFMYKSKQVIFLFSSATFEADSTSLCNRFPDVLTYCVWKLFFINSTEYFWKNKDRL